MYRAVCVDIDGTLLTSEGLVSPNTLDALHRCREQGTMLIVATARHRRSVVRVLPEDFPESSLISLNGARVYHEGAVIAERAMDPSITRGILDALYRFCPGATISMESEEVLLCSRRIDYPYEYEVVDPYSVLDRPILKFIFNPSRARDLDALRSSLPAGCRMLIHSVGQFAEILDSGVSKVWGLSALLPRLGIGLDEIVAFGDDAPDVEMLSECGLGVAMGNASPEIKAAADMVTLSNDEDGIPAALEKLGM